MRTVRTLATGSGSSRCRACTWCNGTRLTRWTGPSSISSPVVTPDEIRALAQTLPRSYEVFVRGQVKFRVGQIVWLALAKDGERMGCGFPKEMRQAAVEAEPHKFQLPDPGDLRFNWIHVRLAAIDADEMRDLVEEVWSRAVPLYVAKEYGRAQGYR